MKTERFLILSRLGPRKCYSYQEMLEYFLKSSSYYSQRLSEEIPLTFSYQDIFSVTNQQPDINRINHSPSDEKERPDKIFMKREDKNEVYGFALAWHRQA